MVRPQSGLSPARRPRRFGGYLRPLANRNGSHAHIRPPARARFAVTAPAISVVMPAFNRAREIRGAIDSVLHQTWTDFELIVVDDCSTDDTVAAIEAVADPRVRLVRHETNAGGAAARNTGIQAARAPWIAFQDSDDEWLPRKLELQRAARERCGPDAAGVYCGMIILGRPEADRVDPELVEYWPRAGADAVLEGDLSTSLLRNGSLISTQTFMGRRDALLAVGGFDAALKALQDWDCFIRVARHGPIAFAPDPLVIQRFSPNSLTKSSRNRVIALERILEKNAEAFQAMPDVLAMRAAMAAGGFRRVGELRRALPWMLRALRLRPFRWRSWVGLGLLLAAALAGPFRRGGAGG